MPFPLASLPPEVVSAHLLPLLAPGDIISLSRCLDFEITRTVYRLAFPDSPEFERYDRQMFEQRLRASVYAIGRLLKRPEKVCHRLPANYEWVYDLPRMHTFVKMECGDAPLVQVGLCDEYPASLGVLDSNGKAYFCIDDSNNSGCYRFVQAGSRQAIQNDYARCRFEDASNETWGHESSKASIRLRRARYNVRKLGTLEARLAAIDAKREEIMVSRHMLWKTFMGGPLANGELRSIVAARWAREDALQSADDERALLSPGPDDFLNESDDICFTDSEELREVSQQYFKLQPSRFTQIHSSHSFAVDEAGVLWHWKHVSSSHTQGVPFFLQESTSGELLRGRISRIRVGWNTYCFQVEGTGIVVVDGRRSWGARSNGWREGYPCFDDHIAAVHAQLVPETASGVSDFYPLNQRLVALLHTDGTITAVDLTGQSVDQGVVNSMGPYTQMVGYESRLMAVTTDHRVVVVRARRGNLYGLQAVAVASLEGIRVASVAVGSSHCLALSTDGEVYSWGTEDRMSGCLGLGRLDELPEDAVVDAESRTLTLSIPTKIRTPGRAYGVYASNGMTAILVAK